MIQSDPLEAREGSLSWLAKTLLFSGAGELLFVGLAFYSFGSLGSALTYFASSGLTADRSSKSFGEVKQGERPRIVFDVTNSSGRQITILGARTRCTCVIAEALPLSVPAGSQRSIKIAINTNSREGEIQEPIQLFTDFPDQHELRITVQGRIVAPHAEPGQKK